MSFTELNLATPILKAVQKCGYPAPTPIQEQAIPRALEGKDLIATAQTGTGKTAAFVLPSLQLLLSPSKKAGRSKGPRVLVLTPTRELANQVTDAVSKYGTFMRMRSGAIVGGVPYFEQNRLLSRPVDMIVATPGRLIDHMESGKVDLSRLELLVLDEADRMLDMGFSEAVNTIAGAAPAARQTLLFTATWDPSMAALARRLLREPVRVEVAGKKRTLEQIEQRLHAVDDKRHKDKMLRHLIADRAMTRALIFSATRRSTDRLARELNQQGHAAEALHGDMTQSARNRTIMNMRRGRIRLLVATDVASRGLDVSGITHVINFDLPKNAEDYVHRIGRTGRAGASGIAISFAATGDLDSLDRIERYIGQTLPQQMIPGLEPSQPLRRAAKGNARRNPSYNGKRGNGTTSGRGSGRKTSSAQRRGFDGRRKSGMDSKLSSERKRDAKRQGGRSEWFTGSTSGPQARRVRGMKMHVTR